MMGTEATDSRVLTWLLRKATQLAVAVALLVPAVASAHIERASYWPDPAPDCSITPCAGGAVPTPRTLASSVEKGGVGTVRVVCQPDSLTRLQKSLAAATTTAYLIRPTHPRAKIQCAERTALSVINHKLWKTCAYNS